MSPLLAGCCNAELDVCVSQPLTFDAHTEHYKVENVFSSLAGHNMDQWCTGWLEGVVVKSRTSDSEVTGSIPIRTTVE